MIVHFTRARDLVVAAFVGLGVGYVIFQLGFGAIQRLPIFAGGTLLLLAVVEVGLAFWVRRRIRDAQLTEPIRAARIVALAKASSLLGAIMGGGWLGVLGYLLPRSDTLAAAARDVPAAVVGVLCACALIAAALWLEHCCRTPEPKDSDRMGESRGSG